MSIPYTKTATTLSLVVGFRPYVIPLSHPNYQQLAKLVTDPKTVDADVINLLDIPKAIDRFTGGNVTVVNGRLFFKGYEVANALAKVILGFVKAGQPEAAKPFERFLEKAWANPDKRASEGLYEWVAASGLPITQNGDIVAWKAVGGDYLSIHSGPRGKLRHQIGDVVEEPRHETDGNPDQTCSRGIHFCAASYLKSYASGGSRIMAVTVSPTDVVAFPKDYNLAKGRACKITVVGEVPLDQVPSYYPQGRPVTGQWGPVLNTRFPVQAGDVWRNRAGDVVTIDRISGAGSAAVAHYGSSGHAVYAVNGKVYLGNDNVMFTDLVELLKEAPAKPKTPRNAHGFAVGQTVRLRSGATASVMSIDTGVANYPLRLNNGTMLTVSGSYLDRNVRHPHDIVAVLTDVA